MVLKSFKTFIVSYFALHVSGTLVPIIRSSLLFLHSQPPVTVCRCVGCVFQLCSFTTVAIACFGYFFPLFFCHFAFSTTKVTLCYMPYYSISTYHPES
jgi:hypothetical protein